MLRRGRLSWLLAIAGALLLAKGSFAVYPFLFSAAPAADVKFVGTEGITGGRESGEPLFQLLLPRQRAEFTVVEGTTNTALRKGPGHLEGSPLPGQDGNSVIAGHRDTHFRVLKDVLIGDEVRVDLGVKEYIYRIVDIRVVSPQDTRVLRPQAEQTITLITCYPFSFLGSAPDRYIVQARLFE